MPAKTDVILANCRNGDHRLEVIYETSIPVHSEEVVRWCRNCGSIVVDVDFDGRTNPGQVMKMKSPLIIGAID